MSIAASMKPPNRIDDDATAIVTGAPDDAASSHPYGLASATTVRPVAATIPRWTGFQPAKVDQFSVLVDRAGWRRVVRLAAC
jgi:hypothetical protein